MESRNISVSETVKLMDIVQIRRAGCFEAWLRRIQCRLLRMCLPSENLIENRFSVQDNALG